MFPVSIALFLCCATFGAPVSRAQDQETQSVAEAARQAHARKHDQQKPSVHVYTNDDLSHPRILTPQDRAQVEARKMDCAQKNNCVPAPSQNQPAGLDANSQTPGTSLGEVARRYRKQKELQALKSKQSSPYHLPSSAPALASPILPERPAVRPPVQPVVHPVVRSRNSSQIFLRDPFSAVPVRPQIAARPRVEFRSVSRENVRPSVRVDSRPEVRSEVRHEVRSDVRPNLRPNVRSIAPRQPIIFSRRAPLTILALPAQPRILAPAPPAKSMQPFARLSRVRPSNLRPNSTSGTNLAQHSLTVQRGDSLWKLAQQNLGRGSLWPKLLSANRWIADPNQIQIGAQLALPVAASAAPLAENQVSSKSGSSTSPIVQVHSGDTLWSLARSQFGHGASWSCIAQANPQVADPNFITPGQLLSIPTSCAP
ncbi:MAG: LysM peptidoglycan-binding domain-containing protein [Candidatus Acidiferrum sp.]